MVYMEKEKLAKVEKIADEFFSLLGVKPKIEIEETEESTLVKVDGEDLGILIGYHGETLESLQLLLSLIVNKQLGEENWVRTVLDVGGWRAEREEALKRLTEETIQRVLETKKPSVLPAMSASQRRFVHLLVQAHPDLVSQSEDSGSERHIVIAFKNQ